MRDAMQDGRCKNKMEDAYQMHTSTCSKRFPGANFEMRRTRMPSASTVARATMVHVHVHVPYFEVQL